MVQAEHRERVYYDDEDQGSWKITHKTTFVDDSCAYCKSLRYFLVHFGWQWVGVIMPYDDSKDSLLKDLRKELETYEICIAYVIKLTSELTTNLKNLETIQNSPARVIIVLGKFLLHYASLQEFDVMVQNITLIIDDSWLYGISLDLRFLQLTRYVLTLMKSSWVDSVTFKPSKILRNWIFYDNTDGDPAISSKVIGSIGCNYITKEIKVDLNKEEVTWKAGTIPESQCNERCRPGYRKAPRRGSPVCCYDCVPCSEGEISNITDSQVCQRCPDEEYPDENKVICIPRTEEYLSYLGDVIALVLSTTSLLCSLVTISVLVLFIVCWDTPIVRANNRTVSFILLTAIFLSFLCVFLFLGRPVDITCMLRQVLFGIFFSIAVSSVLAKTMMVCIAFKATKPGSYCRKWVGDKLPNSIVIICSSIQVLICVIWLSVSPPYKEYDIHSSPGNIIIQCNEGSVIGFYSMLGYMGFLAAVSFVLAFMVRTLPDSFNEAKYITFSMLVFCSVWIAMIPAYLSTRGKYVVAVEVFAMLTSSSGILNCIFFPKCYIMLFKPEVNSKEFLLIKKKFIQ
ncbi:vomeronasal type-2 receptor 26-like [Mantella aurantiaca]